MNPVMIVLVDMLSLVANGQQEIDNKKMIRIMSSTQKC